jgi:lysophospholipase L1-like esterase
MLYRLLLSVCLLIWPSVWVLAQERDGQSADEVSWRALARGGQWLFLGDSNTYAGEYIAVLDALLRAGQMPGEQSPPQLLNLGVPSETASGLSEVDHPFKRPCVHERLDKVLRMLQPTVVFVCYGMNDGIYQPPSAENLLAYQRGMLELVQKIRTRTDALVICLTPPIFEPEPVAARGKLGPSDTGRFAYFAPAGNYNETLRQQANWCMQNEFEADLVIDLHTMLENAKQQRQQTEPEFHYSTDGIHFGSAAHRLVAESIARELGAPGDLLQLVNEELVDASKRHVLLRRDAYLSATGKNRPGLPAGLPIWYVEEMIRRGL